jgi:hypothetical protein
MHVHCDTIFNVSLISPGLGSTSWRPTYRQCMEQWVQVWFIADFYQQMRYCHRRRGHPERTLGCGEVAEVQRAIGLMTCRLALVPADLSGPFRARHSRPLHSANHSSTPAPITIDPMPSDER